MTYTHADLVASKVDHELNYLKFDTFNSMHNATGTRVLIGCMCCACWD